MTGAVAPLLIKHASDDSRFREHPGLKLYGIESYIAVPLKRRDGQSFGTLCALDPLPAELSEEMLVIFHLLSNLIAFELEAEEDGRRREVELSAAQELARAREQLIGILGHDLRNPLNAVTMGTELLLMSDAVAPSRRGVVAMIARSAERMNRMIGDLLDFTRTRLGDGLMVAPQLINVETLARQLMEEFAVSNPGRKLTFEAGGDCQLTADPGRVAQVASNLIANALQHSPDGTPVGVSVDGTDTQAITLAVHNEGAPVPTEQLENLFEPFKRGERSHAATNSPTSGLGLGLYIVRQIMSAHGGTIDARSTVEEGTTFTARWPRRLS